MQHSKLVLVFFVHLISDVTGLLEFSKSLQDLYTIRTVQGVSIATCQLECESRQLCKSAIYYRDAHHCILTSKDALTNSTLVSKGAVLLSGFYTAFDRNGSYSNCDGHICLPKETCATETQGNSSIQVCKITECPNPRGLLSNGTIVKGNIYTIGSNIRVGCDQYFKTLHCETNGRWTNIGSSDCTDMCGSSGVYTSSRNHHVFCDMDTEKGHWLVFQRRQDGSVDFLRNWTEYQTGFGNLAGEFWLGLEIMYEILSIGEYELRVDLEDFDGVRAYAEYSTFTISSELENYTVSATGYSGDAGDSFTRHSGFQFSTIDRDNDIASYSCAVKFSGAWWYTNCHNSNLNGLYYPNGSNTTTYADHVHWKQFRGHRVSLKKTEMKFRRKWNV